MIFWCNVWLSVIKKTPKTLTRSGLDNTVKHGQILVLKLIPLTDKI